MQSWDPRPPTPSSLSDHDVDTLGAELAGLRAALMVTGGIAAFKAPMIARQLRRHGAEVQAYLSKEALRYTTVDAMEWSTVNNVIVELTPQSEHLSKEHPFDFYLVAPATYNTINKLCYGIADTPVTTTLASALSHIARGTSQIFMAPTLHGDLHNAIFEESIRTLGGLGVKVLPPRDAYGKHNLPEPEVLVGMICKYYKEKAVRS
ncbi:MAG: hypothetical protein KDD22_01280 [Bdellovibrionales bacterium]|nr:hypothetical protein [Bdellovibrionales bacterium]